MKKILSCLALLTIYASMHSSNNLQPNNVAHEPNDDAYAISLWYKKVFANQFCPIALKNERPDIAARIGTYVYGETNWLSQINEKSSPRPPLCELEGLIKLQVIQEMNDNFPDLKEWLKQQAK